MSESMSLGSAIGIDAGIAYGVAVIAAMALPETRGRNFNTDQPATAPSQGNATASQA
jgi:hypothetical protein